MAKAKTAAGKARSASERATESRAALMAKGYAPKAWLLPPDALKALAHLTRRHKITETETVSRALVAYADPEGEPSDDELVTMLAERLRLAERRK